MSTPLSLDLDYTMTIFRSIFKLMGCYPDNAGNINAFNKSMISILMLYCIHVTTYSALFEWPNLPEVSLNAVAVFAVTGSICKFFNFVMRPKQFFKLMNTIINDFWSHTSNEEEINIINKYAKLSLKYNIYLAILSYSCGFLTIARAFMKMYVISEGENFHKRVLVFRSWIPFNIDVYADPLYQIFFILQMIGAQVTASIIVAMDGIYLFFVLSTCGQFKILNIRIRTYDVNTNDGSLLSEEQYLKSCIKQHQKLNNVCKELETFLSLGIFGDFLAICPFLCLAGFVFISYTDNYYNILENVLYLLSGFIQLFLYCYAADQLTTESLNIGDAAFTSNWFKSTPKVKKLIIMVIIRAQKPIYLTVLKMFPVTIHTFESVTRSAMSYLTVLNSMND